MDHIDYCWIPVSGPNFTASFVFFRGTSLSWIRSPKLFSFSFSISHHFPGSFLHVCTGMYSTVLYLYCIERCAPFSLFGGYISLYHLEKVRNLKGEKRNKKKWKKKGKLNL
jgi:hypothetical protein